MAHSPPRIFISYGHDSPRDVKLALELAQRLRSDGVDASIERDVFDTPPEGWPRWMRKKFNWADFVLVVCTKEYYDRLCKRSPSEKGKAVGWEGHLFNPLLYGAEKQR